MRQNEDRETNLQMEVRAQGICTEARGKIMFNAIKHLEFRVLVGEGSRATRPRPELCYTTRIE